MTKRTSPRRRSLLLALALLPSCQAAHLEGPPWAAPTAAPTVLAASRRSTETTGGVVAWRVHHFAGGGLVLGTNETGRALFGMRVAAPGRPPVGASDPAIDIDLLTPQRGTIRASLDGSVLVNRIGAAPRSLVAVDALARDLRGRAGLGLVAYSHNAERDCDLETQSMLAECAGAVLACIGTAVLTKGRGATTVGSGLCADQVWKCSTRREKVARVCDWHEPRPCECDTAFESCEAGCACDIDCGSCVCDLWAGCNRSQVNTAEKCPCDPECGASPFEPAQSVPEPADDGDAGASCGPDLEPCGACQCDVNAAVCDAALRQAGECTCDPDCAAVNRFAGNACGDGVCDDGEGCDACPEDCGDCDAWVQDEPARDDAPDPGGFCGDGQCLEGEGCGTCPEDCGDCAPWCECDLIPGACDSGDGYPCPCDPVCGAASDEEPAPEPFSDSEASCEGPCCDDPECCGDFCCQHPGDACCLDPICCGDPACGAGPDPCGGDPCCGDWCCQNPDEACCVDPVCCGDWCCQNPEDPACGGAPVEQSAPVEQPEDPCGGDFCCQNPDEACCVDPTCCGDYCCQNPWDAACGVTEYSARAGAAAAGPGAAIGCSAAPDGRPGAGTLAWVLMLVATALWSRAHRSAKPARDARGAGVPWAHLGHAARTQALVEHVLAEPDLGHSYRP
jgi:hypothetical protein